MNLVYDELIWIIQVKCEQVISNITWEPNIGIKYNWFAFQISV